MVLRAMQITPLFQKKFEPPRNEILDTPLYNDDACLKELFFFQNYLVVANCDIVQINLCARFWLIYTNSILLKIDTHVRFMKMHVLSNQFKIKILLVNAKYRQHATFLQIYLCALLNWSTTYVMSIIVSNCQHCEEQQFRTLSCVHYRFSQ